MNQNPMDELYNDVRYKLHLCKLAGYKINERKFKELFPKEVVESYEFEKIMTILRLEGGHFNNQYFNVRSLDSGYHVIKSMESFHKEYMNHPFNKSKK